MAGGTFTFDTSGTEYPITSVGSGGTPSTAVTTCVVTGDASSEASGDTFTITADGDYRLPDDFGGIRSDLTYDASQGYGPLAWMAAETIQRMRNDRTSTGHPAYAAVAPTTHDGSAGQRWDLLLHPTSNADYTLHLQYAVLANALTDSNNYPYGGAEYREAIIASCEAIVELEKTNGHGGQWEHFLITLHAAVLADQDNTGAKNIGRLTRPEENVATDWRAWVQRYGSNEVIYDGVTY
jgi:hypothetical protein